MKTFIVKEFSRAFPEGKLVNICCIDNAIICNAIKHNIKQTSYTKNTITWSCYDGVSFKRKILK